MPFVRFLRIEGHGDHHHHVGTRPLCRWLLRVLHVWQGQKEKTQKEVLRSLLAIKKQAALEVGQPVLLSGLIERCLHVYFLL